MVSVSVEQDITSIKDNVPSIEDLCLQEDQLGHQDLIPQVLLIHQVHPILQVHLTLQPTQEDVMWVHSGMINSKDACHVQMDVFLANPAIIVLNAGQVTHTIDSPKDVPKTVVMVFVSP